jgi:hypothetical protein
MRIETHILKIYNKKFPAGKFQTFQCNGVIRFSVC